jgi:hypothetical protein
MIRTNNLQLATTKHQTNMCDKATYIRYLKGEGTQYGNSNMYIIRNSSTVKSTEERSLQKIAPPAKLNSDYANQRQPKQGRVAQRPKKDSGGSINRRVIQSLLNGPR